MDPAKFIIFNIRAVRFGKTRYQFDLKVGPITLRDCSVVAPHPDGELTFAAPRRIRGRVSNALIPAAIVEREFMGRVFGDVLEKIAEMEAKHKPSPGPNAEIGGAL
jgi:hypothetical protein